MAKIKCKICGREEEQIRLAGDFEICSECRKNEKLYLIYSERKRFTRILKKEREDLMHLFDLHWNWLKNAVDRKNFSEVSKYASDLAIISSKLHEIEEIRKIAKKTVKVKS